MNAMTQCALRGSLAAIQSLVGQLTQNAQLAGDLAMAYSTAEEPYEGAYEVTPTVEGLALKTRGKVMADDVTVHAIPFYEVSNPSGGHTVYIADEIEME